ncbi:T9SS type A sorting domain-containing protein [Hymenobacter negativus]|uniref:T9SS type A sorting domain-containing protein n=1 Tax=Hymenobacter negativus TaxID=2795026 RepID=A0ABS3QEG6_9BACT|nr:T9SS type A sorting domain-containing protein [Hymenobacter negativus]MBO2009634.1 T9SS type A sorting domain-containing protein [Hymenobacter negativus]
MKHPYSWAQPILAALSLFIASRANAQQAWRPFRPGLIYAFSGPGSSSVHTLRLDSAYRTAAGDSAWAFGRILKTSDGHEQSTNPYGIYRKSRNNLFGSNLLWVAGTSEFVLENVAEGTYQAALSLRLRPRAAVGTTWTASTAPALTATLTSRSLEQVQGVSDSVAVITLSSGQVLRLSRSYGLLEGPQWLGSTSAATQWVQTHLPQTLMQSPYNPLALFTMQPGDEMGYEANPFNIMPYGGSRSHILRRIITRQQTADSLIFTTQEQRRTEFFASPSTSGSVQTYPIGRGRWAFSLRTGKSAQFPALPLLTGEYVPMYASAQPPYYVGRGITTSSSSTGCGPSGQYLSFIGVFPGFNAPAGQYSTGIDIGWQQGFSLALGLGYVFTVDGEALLYYRRNAGSPLTCGSPMNFINLLPTRAAEAAKLATLHPNPATDIATLILAQPARTGTSLHLSDALGRTVWSTAVPAGQTDVAVPIAGQPAGLYLLHLSSPGTTSSWKLTHE